MGHNDTWFIHCEEGYIMVSVLWATMIAGSSTESGYIMVIVLWATMIADSATETGWHNGHCFVGHNDS